MTELRDKWRHLEWWQLTTFTGLRTLRHLDLQLFRTHQILRCNTKARGGHLFDLTTDRIALEITMVPLRVLTTLTGIITPTDTIHSSRNHLVCFRIQRADRHR